MFLMFVGPRALIGLERFRVDLVLKTFFILRRPRHLIGCHKIYGISLGLPEFSKLCALRTFVFESEVVTFAHKPAILLISPAPASFSFLLKIIR